MQLTRGRSLAADVAGADAAESALAQDSERLTAMLGNKQLTRVMRHRREEVLLEFVDGTRLYVDSADPLEFSITADDEGTESGPAG